MNNEITPEFLMLFVGVFILVYLLPWIIAKIRRHNNSMAIFALNLLAGWTFLGYIVAMVWACTNDTHRHRNQVEKVLTEMGWRKLS